MKAGGGQCLTGPNDKYPEKRGIDRNDLKRPPGIEMQAGYHMRKHFLSARVMGAFLGRLAVFVLDGGGAFAIEQDG